MGRKDSFTKKIVKEIPYQILLSNGESFLVDWNEAYEAYKAVCIRIKYPFLTEIAFLSKEHLAVDGIIFKSIKPKEFV